LTGHTRTSAGIDGGFIIDYTEKVYNLKIYFYDLLFRSYK